jgi:hypothetical protein
MEVREKTELCKGPFDNQVGGDHYQNDSGLPGPAEWCMKQNLGTGEGAAIKYLVRHERKGGLEDVNKARQYCEFIAWVKYGADVRRGKTFADYVHEQNAWSFKTFGPGGNVDGLVKHIEKELDEVRQAPEDLEEWIDIIILAMEGAGRSGYSPQDVETMLAHKLKKNRKRQWPDKKDIKPGQPIEHIKGGE